MFEASAELENLLTFTGDEGNLNILTMKHFKDREKLYPNQKVIKDTCPT